MSSPTLGSPPSAASPQHQKQLHETNRFPFGVDAYRTYVSQILWFVMYVVSTLYTFTWDVLQDWGLGYPAYGFLRKKRLFSRPSVSKVEPHAGILICLW